MLDVEPINTDGVGVTDDPLQWSDDAIYKNAKSGAVWDKTQIVARKRDAFVKWGQVRATVYGLAILSKNDDHATLDAYACGNSPAMAARMAQARYRPRPHGLKRCGQARRAHRPMPGCRHPRQTAPAPLAHPATWSAAASRTTMGSRSRQRPPAQPCRSGGAAPAPAPLRRQTGNGCQRRCGCGHSPRHGP